MNNSSLALGGAAAAAALAAAMAANQSSMSKGITQFLKETHNTHVAVQSVMPANDLALIDHNLLGPIVPVERTVTLTGPEVASLGNPAGTNASSISLFLQNGSPSARDRLVYIAPVSQGSNGSETVQAVSITKGEHLIYTSKEPPNQSYVAAFDATGSPTSAGVNAINSANAYLNLANSDPSWAPSTISLAAAANKNVTLR